jgi:hypothetical protein
MADEVDCWNKAIGNLEQFKDQSRRGCVDKTKVVTRVIVPPGSILAGRGVASIEVDFGESIDSMFLSEMSHTRLLDVNGNTVEIEEFGYGCFPRKHGFINNVVDEVERMLSNDVNKMKTFGKNEYPDNAYNGCVIC